MDPQTTRPDLPNRGSTRLRGFDYSSDAAYVVTICSYQRRPVFGTVVDGRLQPSLLGKIIEREWQKTGEARRGVLLDAFVLMPNHLHGIIMLNLPADTSRGKERTGRFVAPPMGLEAIVRGFKSAVTAAARKERPDVRQVWQRGYHDRIVRNETELERFRQYIADNPRQRELDRYFPSEGSEGTS